MSCENIGVSDESIRVSDGNIGVSNENNGVSDEAAGGVSNDDNFFPDSIYSHQLYRFHHTSNFD